jgi:phosphoserine phosphatase
LATRVIIVRHGQSTYNAKKMIQGRCDESVLTSKGIADAQQLGRTLNDLNFQALYCSPLQRAKQTAEIINSCLASPLEVRPIDKLLEVDLPLWEKKTKREVATQLGDDYYQWKENPHLFYMELAGGERHYPIISLYEQAQQFWQEILPQHQGETIAIVGHNGINRCLIASALGMTSDRYHSLQQSNCCINVLNFTGGYGEAVQLESLNQTAHLGIAIPEPRSPHAGPRLLLVRHGETQWNRESRFQGIKDIPLNETGKIQGRKAAEFLKDIPLDFALSSSMLRPKETAELILEHHPDVTLETTKGLWEICHGLWEGKLEAEIEANFPGLLHQWKEAPETVQMPEGENLQQVWDRAIATWEETVGRYSNSDRSLTGIVVAHDAINKAILCYLLGLEPKNFWSIKQGNGAVSVIDYPLGISGKPVLQAINITSHLSDSVLDKTAAGAL